MSKRYDVWAGAAVAGMFIGLAVLLSRSAPPETVTAKNLQRVSEGMTLAEVEAVFGRPSDHFLKSTRIWWGSEYIAYVSFDRDDRVTCWISGSDVEPRPWYEWLKKWLGL